MTSLVNCDNQSPGLCILLGRSTRPGIRTPPGVQAPPLSGCAHATLCLHALGLLVSARLLMHMSSSACPLGLLSIRLLVFLCLLMSTRFRFPGLRMPPGAYTPPTSNCSWCLHVSVLLVSTRLLVSVRPGFLFSTHLHFPGVCTPPNVYHAS